VEQTLCHVANIVLLDTIIGLEVIEQVVEVREIGLVRTDVFSDVRCRERTAIERSRESAVVGCVVHVRQRDEDLEVLRQSFDRIDLSLC
jgi:hypothetical protein